MWHVGTKRIPKCVSNNYSAIVGSYFHSNSVTDHQLANWLADDQFSFRTAHCYAVGHTDGQPKRHPDCNAIQHTHCCSIGHSDSQPK
jgi:hypothetical protein